jgi:hypothetical protein
VADGALYNSCVGLGVCKRARELISAVGWIYLFFFSGDLGRVVWCEVGHGLGSG